MKENVDPLCKVDCKLILLPIICTKREDIASPRPVPLLAVLCACSKDSKILVWSSSDMPIPLSFTRNVNVEVSVWDSS